MSLSGKRYVLTGAASGIGAATGRKLVAAGAEVIGLDRNEPDYELAGYYAVDLSKPESIDEVVAELAKQGPLTGLLNVAGVPGGELPDDFVISVNYLGLRHLTEAITPLLEPGGAITNISSNGDVLWPTREDEHRELYEASSFAEGLGWYRSAQSQGKAEGKSYNFSKEAVSYYTIRKAIEYAKQGLRINAIAPGMTNTPLVDAFVKVMTEDRIDRIKQLVGGFAEPETIADVVVFVASPAAKFVNGQIIDVDGGLKAGMRAGDIPYSGRA